MIVLDECISIRFLMEYIKRMPKPRPWTDEDLTQAIQKSSSLAEAMRALGIRPSGGTYTWIKGHVARLGLDTAHFLGRGHLKGKTHGWSPRIPLDKILQENSSYNRGHLKRRLLEEGLLDKKCYDCQLTEWKGYPVPLELDHVNGIGNDNRLENLRLLCPNCHSLIETYCRSNVQIIAS